MLAASPCSNTASYHTADSNLEGGTTTWGKAYSGVRLTEHLSQAVAVLKKVRGKGMIRIDPWHFIAILLSLIQVAHSKKSSSQSNVIVVVSNLYIGASQ